MHPYVVEEFTDAETAVLRRYFTNLDGPVFALVNLPEVVKGALFARYSRSSKSLRRLFLDEFVGDLDLAGDAAIDATVGPRPRRRALPADLLRIRRRLGRPARRRAPGLRAGEQPPDQGPRAGTAHELPRAVDPLPRLRPATQPTATTASTATTTCSSRASVRATSARWTACSTPTASCCPADRVARPTGTPRPPEDTDFVYRQAIRAKALDGLRGLLPASALSNLGIYASGQAYEVAAAAHARPPAARGARVRPDDARRTREGHPVVPASASTYPNAAAPGRRTSPRRAAPRGPRAPRAGDDARRRRAERVRCAWWASTPTARRACSRRSSSPTRRCSHDEAAAPGRAP